ncbi:MAG: ABC transporter permease subunit [Rhodospirillaceae bacterium]|nr:ABC transporter permease subunit [Rhodospirillaceae bacterium]
MQSHSQTLPSRRIGGDLVRGLDRQALVWLAITAFLLVSPGFNALLPWLKTYPAELVLPITPALNQFMSWFVDSFGFIFKGIAWLLQWPIAAVQAVLHWLPWPATISIVAMLAYRVSGWRLAAFSVVGMLYMVVVGFWIESMNTLSLVAISVPLSVAIGFLLGVAAYRWRAAERIIVPTLDFLQTVPTFAYLLPVIKLFGFGPVTGLITSLLYAFPAMVRNTQLGLKEVPEEVVESGRMSGATPRQLFWLVQVPAARRQIMLGINQTTMAALSMVIVASIIGGSADIGWAVLSTMRKASFGEAFLAGIVIALIAMIMDRITWAIAARDRAGDPPAQAALTRHRHLLIGLALVALFLLLAQVLPALAEWPRDWRFFPARSIDSAISTFIVAGKSWIELIKKAAFYFAMLPVRLGLEATVKPATWGFAWSTIHTVLYVLVLGGLAVYAARTWSLMAGIGIVIWSAVYFFGITNLPWLGLVALGTALAWKVGGRSLALGTGLGLVYLLVAGIWEYAILSIYLCGIAVLLSFLVGTALGIWAAHSPRVSHILRPINDTLQTMPLFVLLIPIVMIFKVGEFTALLAICLYAIVPAIRYSENALRSLSTEVVEAATCMGCTTRQLLFQVKLPLARPGLMLGLNQTIMYGISMLVITALVGTKELGQQVYVGLGNGDFGVGMVAGLGMAAIAMIADRLTQAWSRRQRAELGLG